MAVEDVTKRFRVDWSSNRIARTRCVKKASIWITVVGMIVRMTELPRCVSNLQHAPSTWKVAACMLVLLNIEIRLIPLIRRGRADVSRSVFLFSFLF